ncbi:MAG: hypothetical protein OEM99_15685, partial [Gammaproteobacteria bacterium]|nr:hypothetical protein [Gammaproteobacteria bacterium]
MNKRIAYAAKPVVLLLTTLSFVSACVSSDIYSARKVSELQRSGADTAQRLTPQLKGQFDALEARQFLPVIIRLSDQPDLRANQGVIDAVDKSDRRAAVISHLQQHALNAQHETLDSLSGLQTAGLIRNVQPLWVVNVISAEVTAEAIDYLLPISGIESIAADTEAPLFLADTTWSVRQINSQAVWLRASGRYTGEGIVVAVLDSGVDLDHP